MSSQKLAHKIQQEIGHKKQEHLVALYLNTQNEIIHQQTIFIGTVNRSIAEPREILHYALNTWQPLSSWRTIIHLVPYFPVKMMMK